MPKDKNQKEVREVKEQLKPTKISITLLIGAALPFIADYGNNHYGSDPNTITGLWAVIYLLGFVLIFIGVIIQGKYSAESFSGRIMTGISDESDPD